MFINKVLLEFELKRVKDLINAFAQHKFKVIKVFLSFEFGKVGMIMIIEFNLQKFCIPCL